MRDPIKRAFSAWNHYRDIFESGLVERTFSNKNRREGNYLYNLFFQNRDKFPSFRECIDLELPYINNSDIYEPALLRRGLYIWQLEKFWKYFGKENLLIIGFKDFVDNFEETMARVAHFIGTKNINWNVLDNTPKNVRTYKDHMNSEDYNFLQKFYENPNQILFDAIGPINW